jgi:succinyl-CoA synthetase alpha subunit
MAIFLTRLQGHRPGHDRLRGAKHTTRMLQAGTAVVGGVNPRKAGESARSTFER